MVDANVEVIDIVPTLAAELGVDLPWAADGANVLDPAHLPRPAKVVFFNGARSRVEGPRDILAQVAESTARKFEWFATGDPLDMRAFHGRYGELIGRPADPLRAARPSDLEVVVDTLPLLQDVDPEAEFLPVHVTGAVPDLPDGAPAPMLAVALNGGGRGDYPAVRVSGPRSPCRLGGDRRSGATRSRRQRVGGVRDYRRARRRVHRAGGHGRLQPRRCAAQPRPGRGAPDARGASDRLLRHGVGRCAALPLDPRRCAAADAARFSTDGDRDRRADDRPGQAASHSGRRVARSSIRPSMGAGTLRSIWETAGSRRPRSRSFCRATRTFPGPATRARSGLPSARSSCAAPFPRRDRGPCGTGRTVGDPCTAPGGLPGSGLGGLPRPPVCTTGVGSASRPCAREPETDARDVAASQGVQGALAELLLTVRLGADSRPAGRGTGSAALGPRRRSRESSPRRPCRGSRRRGYRAAPAPGGGGPRG